MTEQDATKTLTNESFYRVPMFVNEECEVFWMNKKSSVSIEDKFLGIVINDIVLPRASIISFTLPVQIIKESIGEETKTRAEVKQFKPDFFDYNLVHETQKVVKHEKLDLFKVTIYTKISYMEVYFKSEANANKFVYDLTIYTNGDK